ncbi:MAG: LysM peptidoglycan-binding domain-containing protein [Bdellovibrionales bacterium]
MKTSTHLYPILAALLFLPLLAACASFRTADQIRRERQTLALEQVSALVPPDESEVPTDTPVDQPPSSPTDETANTEESEDTTGAAASESAKEDVVEHLIEVPQEMDPMVQKWIEYFTVKDRERFQRFIDRGQRYRDVIENVLEQNDLPAELYYLAMIESGFQTHATSTASASGVWQFIAATGQRYGLQVDSDVDERRDPIRSTEAAARYLRDLHNVFGSWHLAMAAYNAGEMRIVRAVFKGKTRDFWELVRKNALPSETANYVPKFLAALMIGRNLETYGFREPQTERYPDLQAVEVPSPVKLTEIAKTAGLDEKELKALNPHLRKDHTPRRNRTYEIWVPVRHVAQLESGKFRLQPSTRGVRSITVADAAAEPPRTHVVRYGENLTAIASKYNVTVAYLKRTNRLRSHRILVGQKLRLTAKSFHSEIVRYRVRRGDNLTLIAKRFGTTVSRIKERNSLRRSKIYVGQVLKLDARM